MIYGLILVIGLLGIEAFWGIPAPMGIIPIIALLATVYPLLFPWLPGRGFAVKGLWLAGSMGIAMTGSVIFNLMTAHEALSAIVFVFAVSILFGLSYTGNSPISNYIRVRRETARFLPLNIMLFLGGGVGCNLSGISSVLWGKE
jgi:acetyl-CoA decarbonylase/synthase complex subunit gamma